MRSLILLVLAVSVVLTSLVPRSAQASGFYLMERGVRSLGRGGAFVAGAEGAESMWINPAGLKGAGESFRMEGNLAINRGTFQRIDDAGTTHPTVDMHASYLPIPMFGATNDFDLEDWDFGFGVYIPSFSLYNWPDHVEGEGGDQPAPNRYSLYSMKGSILANTAIAAAWHGVEGLSIGVSAALIAGRFKASTAMSACDGFVCRFTEDPAYDVTAVLTVRRFASVMIGAGLTYEIGPVKIGGSFQTPWNLKGKADIDVTLPNASLFDMASVSGNKGTFDAPFPWIGRVGVEYKTESFRMELAAVYEGWARQQHIRVQADNMTIHDVVGIGDYQVGTIRLQRFMNNAFSYRAGFEYTTEDGGMTLRMGASYDTTAIKANALTPLTLDANKVVASIGLGLHAGDVMDFDLVYGHIFIPDVSVRNSRITQPTAIRPPMSELDASHIGNGNYTMEADFVGIGSTFKF